MSSFYIVRVELHGGGPADYQTLHHHMASSGFERVITSDTGVTSQLPNGEYATGLNLPVTEVLGLARRAAALTGKTFEVLAVEITSWASWGLKQLPLANL